MVAARADYAAVLAERGAKVVVECQKALVGILARCPGIYRLTAAGDKLPDFDVHAPLMSVPGIVGTEPQNMQPRMTPITRIGTGERGEPATCWPFFTAASGRAYITAEPERIRRWGDELKGLTGFKIGIAWQGSKNYQDDQFRSISLGLFAPVAGVAGTRLISLQKGYGAEQLASGGRKPPVSN